MFSQRAVELGCTDITTVPSLFGLCPWLLRCSATQKLAAVLCGSKDRLDLVDAAVRHLMAGVSDRWQVAAASTLVAGVRISNDPAS